MTFKETLGKVNYHRQERGLVQLGYNYICYLALGISLDMGVASVHRSKYHDSGSTDDIAIGEKLRSRSKINGSSSTDYFETYSEDKSLYCNTITHTIFKTITQDH